MAACPICSGENACTGKNRHFQVEYDTSPADDPYRDGRERRIYVRVSARSVHLPMALEELRGRFPRVAKFQIFPVTYLLGKYLSEVMVIVEIA